MRPKYGWRKFCNANNNHCFFIITLFFFRVSWESLTIFFCIQNNIHKTSTSSSTRKCKIYFYLVVKNTMNRHSIQMIFNYNYFFCIYFCQNCTLEKNERSLCCKTSQKWVDYLKHSQGRKQHKVKRKKFIFFIFFEAHSEI